MKYDEIKDRIIQDNIGVPIKNIKMIKQIQDTEIWVVEKTSGYKAYAVIMRTSPEYNNWLYFFPAMSQSEHLIESLNWIKNMIKDNFNEYNEQNNLNGIKVVL